MRCERGAFMQSRRPLFLSLLVVAAVAGAATFFGCGDDEGEGTLVATPDVLDFGLVAHGEDVERVLSVKNEGPRGVVLTAAAPSCACLHVLPFNHSVGPGEVT